jgi:hypothetical protein
MEFSRELIGAIAQVGRENPSRPALEEVEIFSHYFDPGTGLPLEPDRRDGSCTRRDLLMRYLLLNAVLDQGPDSEGVRRLLVEVTNDLYRREVRFLHKPEAFFQELGIAVDHITAVHDLLKEQRAEEWAEANQSSPSKYNLFLNSAQQVLNYAVFRWGTPLAVPLILTRDEQDEAYKPEALSRYVEQWDSAEVMSKQLKEHPRYGLGKAVGYKATHLYAKWIVHTFHLAKREDAGWGPYSFEIPFDSNAGRVLFRTGFFYEWASQEEYEKWEVLQRGKGKQGTTYIRVTNIRGKGSKRARRNSRLFEIYRELCYHHLRVLRGTPRTVQIQRIPLVLLLEERLYTAGDLDDGLMYIGTHYCYNHAEPDCSHCPILYTCRGYQEARSLITDYRT